MGARPLSVRPTPPGRRLVVSVTDGIARKQRSEESRLWRAALQTPAHPPKLPLAVRANLLGSEVQRRARLAWWAAVVRCLVTLALALQLSGALHVVVDIACLTGDAAAAHFADDDATDCPPGCPSCHHVNGGVAAPPCPSAVRRVAPAADTPSRDLPYHALIPPAPARDSLFRPPRSISVTLAV